MDALSLRSRMGVARPRTARLPGERIHSTVLTNPPGHLWRDKWTALSGPSREEKKKESRGAAFQFAGKLIRGLFGFTQ